MPFARQRKTAQRCDLQTFAADLRPVRSGGHRVRPGGIGLTKLLNVTIFAGAGIFLASPVASAAGSGGSSGQSITAAPTYTSVYDLCSPNPNGGADLILDKKKVQYSFYKDNMPNWVMLGKPDLFSSGPKGIHPPESRPTGNPQRIAGPAFGGECTDLRPDQNGSADTYDVLACAKAIDTKIAQFWGDQSNDLPTLNRTKGAAIGSAFSADSRLEIPPGLVVDSHGVCHIIDTRRNDKIAGGINSFECAVDKLGGTKARTGTSCAAQTGSVAPAGNAVPAGTEVPVASAKPTGTMAPAGNAATVGAGTAGATVVGGYAPPVGSAGPAREGDEQSTPRADSSPKAPISLRLSGTPVQLAKGQANSSSSFDFANHENNDIFISASKATLGFKETNSDQVTNNITGTLGVPLQMKDRFNFTDVAAIPYVFIDREAKITNTYETSKSGTYVLNSLGRKIPLTTYSFTTNMVSTGAMLTGSLDKTKSFFNDLCQNCIENEVWSLRADYLFDYINQVDLLTTSLYYAPVSKSIIPINYLLDVFSSSSQVKFTFLLDARIKAGWYENAVPGGPATQQVTTTGLDVRVAQDYFRPGGQVGAAIELRCLLPGLCFPDYPIDLAVSYTDFYGLTGFHKSLGFFQTSASVSFGNNVSVIATYANGRRDDNTQQWEAWGINIGLGF